MSDIANKLRDEVLARAACEDKKMQNQLLLDSTSAALVDTTTLDHVQIEAIRRGIEEETRPRTSSVLSVLPAVNLQYVRIAVYLFLGFIAYSAYRAAQVDTLQQQQDYASTSSQSAFDLISGVRNLQMLLTDTYQAFYKSESRLPQSVADIEPFQATLAHLGASSLFKAYEVHASGGIRLELSDNYGYHRWIILSPLVSEHWAGVSIEFACQSNAQEQLLQLNGRYWCTPITR